MVENGIETEILDRIKQVFSLDFPLNTIKSVSCTKQAYFHLLNRYTYRVEIKSDRKTLVVYRVNQKGQIQLC